MKPFIGALLYGDHSGALPVFLSAVSFIPWFGRGFLTRYFDSGGKKRKGHPSVSQKLNCPAKSFSGKVCRYRNICPLL